MFLKKLFAKSEDLANLLDFLKCTEESQLSGSQIFDYIHLRQLDKIIDALVGCYYDYRSDKEIA